MVFPPSLSVVFAKLLALAIRANPTVDTSHLEGRSFALNIDEFPQVIGIKFEHNQISALNHDALSTADVTLSGNIKAILTMIKGDEDSLNNEDLYLAGKMSSAKHFQQFLSALSVDWQGFFSQILPSPLAEKTAEAVEQGLDFAKDGLETLTQQLKCYLIEDKKLFISRAEFESLHQQTRQLVNRIERLRLNQRNDHQ